MNTGIEKSLEPIVSLYDWTSVRWEKCKALYQFAKEATGPIVELGCYDGNGTLALALGSRDGNNVPVYAIDQFKRFTGLYQQQFYPEDEIKLKENIVKVGVDNIYIIKGDSKRLPESWESTINLLVWDISLPQLWDDWLAWHSKVHGLFIAKDTTTFDFGWLKVKEHALKIGWQLGSEIPEACLWSVRND